MRFERAPLFFDFGAELNCDPYNRFWGSELYRTHTLEDNKYYKPRDRTYLVAVGGNIRFGKIRLGMRVKGIKNSPPFKISKTTWENEDDSLVANTESGKESAVALDFGFSYRWKRLSLFLEAENTLKTRLDYFIFHNSLGRTNLQAITGLPLNVRVGGFMKGKRGDWYRLTFFYIIPQEVTGEVFRGKYVFGPGGSFAFGIPLKGGITLFSSISLERYSIGVSEFSFENERRISILTGLKFPTYFGYTSVFFGWDDANSGIEGASTPITVGLATSI